ncbi:MAG: septum formation protein Maf [Ignavibacteriae bacterium]|nr:septum formation protein Maf [Ignavibacteriota bacterium]MCB9260072.1 septum formation protein Maf [Ignavibacteriales bacterium]
MISSKDPIYLASKSPRRKEMLKMMGIKFKSLNLELDEILDQNQTPIKNVKRIALEKCLAALDKVDVGIIITADTIVVIDGEIIGKPKNKKEAKEILTKLSGRSHSVYTGFSIANKRKNKIITDYSLTKVYFRELSETEISDYIKTGSPLDKAGAYGIQDDFGAVFVKKINGCYYNVMGFPVSKIYKGIKELV